jgi:pimeloyl-ACP methyl ester carboxylesterase
MEHTTVATNGIHLHVVKSGPETGPLVILLHGFPEFWYAWRKQIPKLAAAGYHVWAPDQRGYNLSVKPHGIDAYTIDKLGADVLGLIDAAGRETVFLVGHDWGAAIAWWIAVMHPNRIARMAVINVPHGTVMLKHLRYNVRQMLRSWYIFFFQFPWLPEALSRVQNWRAACETLLKSSRPGTFSSDDLDTYRKAWSQPEAYTCMVNWYRAIIQRPPRPPENPRISIPTLLIWGARDRFLGRQMAQPSIELCDKGRLVFIEEATHWVQHEEADRVNHLLLDFLSEASD